MSWTTAVPDWRERIISGDLLIPFDPLFAKECKAAMQIFNDLRLRDVQGQPRLVDCSRRWLLSFVEHVFGSYDADTGRRLINEFFLLISKKNSKSSTAAGIMITALVRNWRESAEFLIVAPTIEIANNSYYPARDMVISDPELSQLLHIQDQRRTITHRLTGATLKVIAADNETVGGKKASGILIDELWIFGKRLNAENMIREATGGLASRPEGFVIYLSTQSDEAPRGIFKSKLSYARSVRDGEIEDQKFLPVLYEFPEDMVKKKAYLLPQNFYITNPNLGASVDEEFLTRELKKAQAGGDESLPGFLAKHLNVECGLTLRSDRWAGALFWQQCAGASRVTLERLLKECEVISIGIDGGGLDDMLGMAALGRKPDGKYLLWNHAWIHPIVLERRQTEAEAFKDFQREGDLTIVDAIGQDVTQVAETCARIHAAGLLDRIGVDPAGIGAVVDEIVRAKIDRELVIGIPQGWRMVGAIKTLERLLAGNYVEHSGSGLMMYCVGNARIEQRANSILVTKQASGGSGKIDPLIASFDAMTLMSDNPKAKRKDYQVFFVG